MQSYYHEWEGARLYIEEFGSGPVLICLPGLGGEAGHFRPLADLLQDQYRILALDLPDTGKSQGRITRNFSFHHCIPVLNSFFKKFPAKSISILAHSMSTMIALKLYKLNSEPFRSFIYLGGLPKVRDGIRPMLNLRIDEINRQGMTGMGQKIIAGVFSREFRNAEPILMADFSKAMESLSPNFYKQGLIEVLATDTESLIGEISIPSLVLTGSEDLYAPPKWAKAFAHTLGETASYAEILGSGHMPFLEKPKELSFAIAAFLKKSEN